MIWLLFSLFTVVHAQPWQQVGPDIKGNANDYLGSSNVLNLDGTIMVASTASAVNKLKIYNTTDQQLLGEMTQPSGCYNCALGGKLAMNADASVIAFGDYRSIIHIYKKGETWSQWTNIGTLEFELSEMAHTPSLSDDGYTIAVGAYKNNNKRGAVYVYTYDGTTWTQRGLTQTGTEASDEFGTAVGLNSDGSVLAAAGSGSPYNFKVFQYSENAWAPLGDEKRSNDNYHGRFVSLSSDGMTIASNGEGGGYIWEYSQDTDTWISRASFSSIKISKISRDGKSVVYGSSSASLNGYTSNGFAKVARSNGDTWSQVGDMISLSYDYAQFPTSVSINEDGTILALSSWSGAQSDNTGFLKIYELPSCSADERVNNFACSACPPGFTNEEGDKVNINSECDPIICADTERVENHACVACPNGMSAGGNATQGDTSCTAIICEENFKVQSNLCEACSPGSARPAGDDATQGDTECDILYCEKDEKVVSNVCTACPPGTIRTAGDDATGADTSCNQAICSENHRVHNNECVPCEDGLIRLAGDRADRADTECFDASTCGGVTCDPTGTEACVQHKCVCNNLFGGQDCSKDRSPSARRQKLIQARKKALPTRENLKQRQKEVKDFAREILQEEIAKGLSTKQAVKNARVEVDLQDIQQEVQVVVSKMAKTPVLAVAPENKDETDTCDQGPACATLDIAEEGDKITFLDTAEEVGSWTALANGDDIVSKQTRVSETVYDMQCWNNTWSVKTTVDVTTEGKLYECNGHIILVGSQASICTPTTCQNGGTCTVDGLSFKCTCPEGFTGEFCETAADITHCHQMDCSDFGGHKAGECTDCTVANCCNYNSRALFDAHCDTLTATQDFVNAKCCHRTYCL